MATVSIELPADTERRLRELAMNRGETVEAYLSALAERDLALNDRSAAQRRAPFATLVAPIASAARASGMSADEVDDLFEVAVADIRTGRHAELPSH